MQSTIQINGKMTPGLDKSKTYIELLQAFPPHPIKSESELFTTQKVIDSLIDRAPLTTDEEDYLNVLGTLVYEYERSTERILLGQSICPKKSLPIPDIYGIELLKVLMEEHGLRQKDLVPIFKTESIVSDILKSRRKLTTRHIQELAELFHLSPTAFFPT